jgi:ribosomal protein S18 acetylase RimI-like enzyme
MEHLLDNPVWHALIGPHAHIAVGHGLARHYPRDIAPFSAIADATPIAYNHLAAELPRGIEARLFRLAEEPAPSGWDVISSRPIIQMMADDVAAPNVSLRQAPTELGADDAQEMLQLAEIARPGPFGPHTQVLGAYVGYRDCGELVAMGGERFRLPGFVELSAICVHPKARGRGFGAAITLHLAQLALARGETPFLHVFPDNRAAALYRCLGFRERARLWVIWRRVRGMDR